MHSTKPIHTRSDVRMHPAFITLTGCTHGRPSRKMSDALDMGKEASHHRVMGRERRPASPAHSTVRISGPPDDRHRVFNCPTMPSSAQASTWYAPKSNADGFFTKAFHLDCRLASSASGKGFSSMGWPNVRRREGSHSALRGCAPFALRAA